MIMNLIEMRKYLETGFGAKHMATGRVFILLESFGIPAKHIGGLDKQNLVMVECYLEVVDGVLVPGSLPLSFFLDEFKAIPLSEIFPKAFMESDSLHDIAVAENRIGCVTVSDAVHEAFLRYANLCPGLSVVSADRHDASSRTTFTIICPDFHPVKDGMKTPFYTMQVFEDSDTISWALDKSFEL